MVDYVKITTKAGKGGDGTISFARKRGKKFGRPEGGDGGDGGSVCLAVDRDLTTLIEFRYKKDFKAGDGQRGGKNNKRGAEGGDLVLSVPAGTRVEDSKGRLFADLTSVGEKVMAVKGGKGGRGNAHMKRSELRVQNEEFGRNKWSWFEKGFEGQEINLVLELKLLADVGLVGLPNAGKSTLLSVITAATPKIADYPFTTLEPNLGVMTHKGKELVIADIPGLIEGASKGKGLGDIFLRHVERTKVLVHLVSAQSADLIGDIETIRQELKSYSKDLSSGETSLLDKPEVVLLTKIDTLNKEELKKKTAILKKKKIVVMAISSVSGEGLEQLKNELIRKSS
jgi:GTP-binding protein